MKANVAVTYTWNIHRLGFHMTGTKTGVVIVIVLSLSLPLQRLVGRSRICQETDASWRPLQMTVYPHCMC